MNFKTFFEKNQSNPLRKQQIKDEGGYEVPSPEERRFKIDGKFRKILEIQGIQVFLDRTINSDFSPNSPNMRNVRYSVMKTLNDLRGIIPVKTPKIIIADRDKNKIFLDSEKENGFKSKGLYWQRHIWIDQNFAKDPNTWKHEIAHYVADLIPKQTEPLLEKAYQELLDSYWSSVKKKKRYNLEPEDPSFVVSRMKADRMRENISKKLGFPSYGITNFHEFFAVLIENWSSLRNDRNTYRFKQLVKGVLSRL